MGIFLSKKKEAKQKRPAEGLMKQSKAILGVSHMISIVAIQRFSYFVERVHFQDQSFLISPLPIVPSCVHPSSLIRHTQDGPRIHFKVFCYPENFVHTVHISIISMFVLPCYGNLLIAIVCTCADGRTDGQIYLDTTYNETYIHFDASFLYLYLIYCRNTKCFFFQHVHICVQDESPPSSPRNLSATLASSLLTAEFKAFLANLDKASQGKILSWP